MSPRNCGFCQPCAKGDYDNCEHIGRAHAASSAAASDGGDAQYWAAQAMHWRKMYSELKHPGMTNVVKALATPPAAAPVVQQGDALTVIGYTSPGCLRRLRDREDDSLTVDAECIDGCDVPVYAALNSGAKGDQP